MQEKNADFVMFFPVVMIDAWCFPHVCFRVPFHPHNGQASVLSADVCQGRSNFSGFEKLFAQQTLDQTPTQNDIKGEEDERDVQLIADREARRLASFFKPVPQCSRADVENFRPFLQVVCFCANRDCSRYTFTGGAFGCK
jgi:hypothetical protein